jgi:phage shock protein PspC (stress-responsive transcriptional regulator)
MNHNDKIGGKVMSDQKKVLRRSRSDRVVAGVCGGLAEFFGISAFWFRLAFLIALIPGGVPGLLPYILFWIIIPKEK